MKKPKKKPKTFSLTWIYEDLEEHPTFFTRKMFGSLAVYYGGKMVLVLSESPGDKEYRGKIYPFDVWNGLLLPTMRDFHKSLMDQFPDLTNHPVLPKWLYLPMSTPEFEKISEELVELILEADERIGILADLGIK